MFSKTLIKILVFVTMILSTFHNFQQSFRLLFRTKSEFTYFVDLTFNCSEHRLQNSGCLSKVEIYHFHANPTSHVSFIYGARLVTSYKNDMIISYKEHSIFRIETKNSQHKNSLTLQRKIAHPHTIHMGIPIPVNINSMDEMLQRRPVRTKKSKRNKNELIPLSYLIDLSYKVYKDRISDFEIVNTKTKLVHFKETTPVFNKTKEIQNKTLFNNVFDWFREKYKPKDPNEELYNFYEGMFTDSFVYPQDLKLGVIVFIDRIELNNEIIKNRIKKDFDRNNDKFTAIPCYEDNLVLIIMANRIFVMYPNDNVDDTTQTYKLQEDFSPYLIGLYEVKKVVTNGENARNK